MFSEPDQLKKQPVTVTGTKDKNKLTLKKGTTELAMLRDEKEKRKQIISGAVFLVPKNMICMRLERVGFRNIC